jgi:ketosteroid isomerase-like protein
MSEAMTATWRVTDGLDMWFVEIGEDQVVCFVSFLGESRHTGRAVAMRMVERYRLVGGRIAEIELFYWDTAAIAEATGGVKTIAPA